MTKREIVEEYNETIEKLPNEWLEQALEIVGREALSAVREMVERRLKEFKKTPLVRINFCQYCDDVVLEEEVCDCETEVNRQHLIASIEDDLLTQLQADQE